MPHKTKYGQSSLASLASLASLEMPREQVVKMFGSYRVNSSTDNLMGKYKMRPKKKYTK